MLDLEQHAILQDLGGAFLPTDGSVPGEADLAGWALGDHALAPRWRDAARRFPNEDEARGFLRDHGFGCAHDARALATGNWPERLASGHGWCLPVYPRIVSRPGLYTLEGLPDEAFEVGAAAGAAINSDCGTRIDYKFICRQEGYQWRRGYLVFQGSEKTGHNVGRSGVTIGSGFDLGQQTEAKLRKLGFPERLIAVLLPYIGVEFVLPAPTAAHPHAMRPMSAGEMTAIIARRGPLPVVNKEDADLIDQIAFKSYTETTRRAWEEAGRPRHPRAHAHPHGHHHAATAPAVATAPAAATPPAPPPVPPPPVLKPFTALSGAWQTVLLDWVYQNGAGVFTHKDFAQAAARGDAATAKRLLGAATDYPQRRQAEYRLIVGDTTSLTQPAPAAVPAAPMVPR